MSVLVLEGLTSCLTSLLILFSATNFVNELSKYLHQCPVDVIFLDGWEKQMLMSYSLMISKNMLLNSRAVICRLHNIPFRLSGLITVGVTRHRMRFIHKV